MRHFILLSLITLSFTIPSNAEEALLCGNITHGGYGAPVAKFTTINGEFAVLAGGQGGWIISHTFAIGGGGFGLATEHHPESVPISMPWTTQELRTAFGYGGVILSFIGMSDHMLHPTVDLLIGGGELHSDVISGWDDEEEAWDEHHDCPTDRFFVVEPTVSAELNIVRFMRLNAGAGYRFVNGVADWGYSNQDFGGLSVSAMLKFGKF